MIGVVVVLLLLMSQATAVAEDPAVTQARIFLYQQKVNYKRNQLWHEKAGLTFEEYVNHNPALKVVGTQYMLRLKIDLDRNRDRLNQEARALSVWKQIAVEQAARQRFLRDHGRQLVAQNQMLLAMLSMGGAGGGRSSNEYDSQSDEEQPLTFTSEGHLLMPMGPDFYLNARTNRVMMQFGPNGVVDQKTGQFVPAH